MPSFGFLHHGSPPPQHTLDSAHPWFLTYSALLWTQFQHHVTPQFLDLGSGFLAVLVLRYDLPITTQLFFPDLQLRCDLFDFASLPRWVTTQNVPTFGGIPIWGEG